MRHNHSPRMRVIKFNRSHANIGRASTPLSLYYIACLRHIYILLCFAHIPLVVNHKSTQLQVATVQLSGRFRIWIGYRYP